MTKQYGSWKVERSLDEGGQGITFLVRDMRSSSDTLYVLKRLKNTKRIKRFSREIEAIMRLAHPNIVRLIDYELSETAPFLVTEYCPGGSLGDPANRAWLSDHTTTLSLFLQLCNAVKHAHDQGVFHRDIKPHNVFLRPESGELVLGDFGLCLFDDYSERITTSDEAVGPRLYMAPEFEDGKLESVTAAADVYSLGKLLYWLFADRVFSREKHREQGWDLRNRNEGSATGWSNVHLEHINRILDVTVQAHPEHRISLPELMRAVVQARRLLAGRYVPVDYSLRMPCAYCGHGAYELQPVENPGMIRNFGLTPTVGSDWRILVCNQCGHVQLFRVDLGARKDWWVPKQRE